MGLSRQEYWSGLPFLSPGDLPDPGVEPRSALQADALRTELQGKPSHRVWLGSTSVGAQSWSSWEHKWDPWAALNAQGVKMRRKREEWVLPSLLILQKFPSLLLIIPECLPCAWTTHAIVLFSLHNNPVTLALLFKKKIIYLFGCAGS